MNKLIMFFLLCVSLNGWTQSYAPAAGESGSTAIHMSDSKIIGWATNIEVTRGFVNIEDTTIEAAGNNRASFGEPSFALGAATGDPADVVSLGDKGVAVVTFDQPIFNGPGFDFAIFENSFSDTYLEFAHVEVSSNGVDFVRFPSHSEVQDQVQIHGFGSTDPKMIYNLAGKYRGGYGTPFDLQELEDSLEININNITHVKIIDVVGSIGDSATYDSYGNKVNEPFSTPYESGGFDLDAVGVMNHLLKAPEQNADKLSIYPNPTNAAVKVQFSNTTFKLIVRDALGKMMYSARSSDVLHIDFPPGVYYFQVVTNKYSSINKVIFN